MLKCNQTSFLSPSVIDEEKSFEILPLDGQLHAAGEQEGEQQGHNIFSRTKISDIISFS